MDSIQGNYFKDFLDVLFKRKVMILLFFLATVLTAMIGVSFSQKVKYEALFEDSYRSQQGLRFRPLTSDR